ncbi:caspase family protein [Aliifodinibius sp. S!AR15-10]|uniref:caspase, EACC1-associated type n=1 Tax=Aliifodinibius sp. S!AR15-10 TaxID=2950437 RepID=UPI0028549CE7|nr:caspase family protein [Aliifodinibius sp. S!AR15-10]MDR8393017.1 caspase family protein [Aliifodinibius sp. S!AR15-10]
MSRKYALFVGNSEYDSDSLVDLEAPLADVRDLANLFRDEKIGGFDEVVELINSPESEIRQTIGGFFLNKKPEDLLLLYFSGHGVLDDRGHLYLAVKDTRPDLLRATAISADFIADDMDLCRSKRQILILDCCHSGAFRRGIKGGGKALTASTFEGNGSGRIVLTASDRREFAMEGNQVLDKAKTSLFTHFLLEGIMSGEADRDGDSFISLDEWYDYAYEKVVSNLPTQTPRRWVYNQEGRLIIARNPCPEKNKPAELHAELQGKIADSNPKVRLGAISKLGNILDSRDNRLKPQAREALVQLQEDENEKVKQAATRVLKNYESILLDEITAKKQQKKTDTKVTKEQPGASAWDSLLSWFRTNLGIAHWRRWVAITMLAAGVVFGARGLLTMLDNSNGTEEGNIAEQAEMGGVGNMGLPPEETDPNDGEGGETSLSNKSTPAETRETVEQDRSSDPPKEALNEMESRPNNQQMQPITKQDPQNNQQPGNIAGSSEAEQDILNQQDPQTTGGENIAANEPENLEETPAPEQRPIDRLHSELDVLQENVREAITDREWSGLPAPLADYYSKMLANFYSMFNVVDVESVAGELESDEKTAKLPVTMTISYRQKGRDEVKELPFPAHWIWQKNGDQFVLSSVQAP